MKKGIILAILWLSATALRASDPQTSRYRSVVFLPADSSKVQRVQVYTPEDLLRAKEKLTSAKVMTGVGAALVITSPVIFFPGMVMTAGGLGSNNRNLAAAGITLMALGTANFLAGVPLVTIGGVRWAEWEDNVSAIERNMQLQAVIKGNGHVGLCLKF